MNRFVPVIIVLFLLVNIDVASADLMRSKKDAVERTVAQILILKSEQNRINEEVAAFEELMKCLDKATNISAFEQCRANLETAIGKAYIMHVGDTLGIGKRRVVYLE